MAEAIAKPHVAKGDTVVIRRGKEKGKRGIVKAVFPKDGTATVEGLNVIKRHTKPGQAGAQQSGGIFEKEAPLPLSVLQIIDPKTNLPTRVRRSRTSEGLSIRVSVRSGEQLPIPVKG
ncbi:MAG: 50S ribosomal protein L24 [Candidatus Velthaea sp.]